MELNDVIKRPVITEKSTALLERGQYTFQVARQATKKEIGRAVEKFFDKVKVGSVKTVMVRKNGKKVGRQKKEGKKSIWKKAIVQLAEGEIDILPSKEKKGKK